MNAALRQDSLSSLAAVATLDSERKAATQPGVTPQPQEQAARTGSA